MTRPYPMPPTNVQLSNDYTGDDRGHFLSREPTKRTLKVSEAVWQSYGPNAAPGILKFKLAIGPSFTTNLKAPDGTDWFETATSGPNFRPILVEYWARNIYYGYYANRLDTSPVDTKTLDGLLEAGNSLTSSFSSEIKTISNTIHYSCPTPTKALEITSYQSAVTLVDGNVQQLEQVLDTTNDKFDPVLFAMKANGPVRL